MLRIMSDVSKELVDQVLTKTGWSHASAKLWNGPRSSRRKHKIGRG